MTYQEKKKTVSIRNKTTTSNTNKKGEKKRERLM